MLFQTKSQITLALIDRASGNGVQVRAWTYRSRSNQAAAPSISFFPAIEFLPHAYR
jgi:hypothetical protein